MDLIQFVKAHNFTILDCNLTKYAAVYSLMTVKDVPLSVVHQQETNLL